MACCQCGKCCEAIRIERTSEQLQGIRNPSGDVLFVIKNWEEISEDKAFRINPFLEIEKKHFYAQG